MAGIDSIAADLEQVIRRQALVANVLYGHAAQLEVGALPADVDATLAAAELAQGVLNDLRAVQATITSK